MKLVEKHIIRKGRSLFKVVDALCFLAKNVYNAALYAIRQHFFKTGELLSYYQIQKLFQNEKQADYYALPAKVSQQILMLVCANFQSFFQALQAYKENPEKFLARPRLPGYKHKTKGRCVVVYTSQAVSVPLLRKGIIQLSKSAVSFPTKQENIQQVRIVPRYNHCKIEVVYEAEPQVRELDFDKIAGIDIGLDNLAAVTSNHGQFSPILINGRPLKAINYYFNKMRSKLMSFVSNRGSCRRIEKLTHKRNCKIDFYLHNSSRFIIKLLLQYHIGTLVIGKNDLWKQSIALGKRNNQNFVSIPHASFVSQLQYKAQLAGIRVYIVEESYTSKCSFLDNEPLQKHASYAGKRLFRGLFRSFHGQKINADINGSANIIRKVFPNAFADGIQGVVVPPKRVNPLKAEYFSMGYI